MWTRFKSADYFGVLGCQSRVKSQTGLIWMQSRLVEEWSKWGSFVLHPTIPFNPVHLTLLFISLFLPLPYSATIHPCSSWGQDSWSTSTKDAYMPSESFHHFLFPKLTVMQLSSHKSWPHPTLKIWMFSFVSASHGTGCIEVLLVRESITKSLPLWSVQFSINSTTGSHFPSQSFCCCRWHILWLQQKTINQQILHHFWGFLFSTARLAMTESCQWPIKSFMGFSLPFIMLCFSTLPLLIEAVFKKGGFTRPVSVSKWPNSHENPHLFALDPYGNNNFFCKLCWKELSNIYMHCDGCKILLSKDFNICMECWESQKYKVMIQMHPLNSKKCSTINLTGNMSFDHHSQCCPCKNGPVCQHCKFCAGCSCKCHQ